MSELTTAERYRVWWNRSRCWPTCRGENPPRGIPYRSFGGWFKWFAIELRVWRYR